MMETAITHGLKLGFHSLGNGAAVSALILAPFEPGRSTAPPRKLHQPLERPRRSRLRTRPHFHDPWLQSERRTFPVQARVASVAPHRALSSPARVGLLSRNCRSHFPAATN